VAGLQFYKFKDGQGFEHAITPNVKEHDNLFATVLSLNPQFLYLDLKFVAKTDFKKPLVICIFALALFVGVSTY
jgi:acyl dehydratase